MASINGTLVPMAPPPGYVVNFDNPQRNVTPNAYYAYGIGLSAAFIFLVQRIYTKAVLIKKFHTDDWCLIIAWLLSLVTVIPALYEWTQGNIGIHMWEIPIDRFQRFLFVIFLAPVVYAPCQVFAKLTLLLFYHRLSPVKTFKYAVNFTIAVVVSYNLAIMLALIFACWPVQKSFDLSITEGSCTVNLTQLYIATAVLGIITDLVILVLPLPTVLRLQVSRAQKIGLVFIFSIGSATFVTSIVRLGLLIPTIGATDVTWVIADATMWVGIEANLLIICGSLPTLRKFTKHVGPKIFGESFAAKFTSAKRHTAGNNSYPLKATSGSSKLSSTGNNGFSRLREERNRPPHRNIYGVETTVLGDAPSSGPPTPDGPPAGTRTSQEAFAHTGVPPRSLEAGGIMQTRETIVQYEPRR